MQNSWEMRVLIEQINCSDWCWELVLYCKDYLVVKAENVLDATTYQGRVDITANIELDKTVAKVSG
jgi:hypothetical protein